MTAKNRLDIAGLLTEFPVHRGGTTESLIEKMIEAGPGTDPWGLDLTEEERRLVGRALISEPRQPTDDELRSAVARLARRRLSRRFEAINRELVAAEEHGDPQVVDDLMLLKRVARWAADVLEEF